jgi:hypothetical protein
LSLRSWQVAALLAATLTMRLMAGVFGVYAHSIMRGLTKTDDRTFVGAFQATDRAIINPLFLLAFMGALVLTGIAGMLHLRDDDNSLLPWVAAALGLYLGRVRHHHRGPRAAQRRDQGRRRSRPHRRPGRGARRLPKDPLGRVERRPGRGDHGGVRVPDVGARHAWPSHG